MAWQGIEGHDAIAARFARAQAHGRLAGSFLFIGPAGVGKSTFAQALARALTCGSPATGLVACGRCASCVQALAGSHPDIDVVRKPDDKATIPLEVFIGDPEHRMREGLCWRLLLGPQLGGRKVAIILDADHLADEAANCLLKTLEEPPESAVIILVGTTLERQLPTIRSRCQVVRFGGLSAATVQRLVAAEAEAHATAVDPATLAAIAAAAGGSLARARLLLDPEGAAFRERLLRILAAWPLPGVELAREANAFVDAAGKDAPPRRARLRMILDTAIDVFREAALRAANAGATAPGELAAAAAAWAADPDRTRVAIECTLDALAAVDRNANLGILVDAWTSMLEEPRLATPA